LCLQGVRPSTIAQLLCVASHYLLPLVLTGEEVRRQLQQSRDQLLALITVQMRNG
jgi:hypothetical protein